MPGRNDPCPCGSGKKYKKCHLERDGEQASGVDDVHALDKRLLDEIVEFGATRFGGSFLPRAIRDLPPDDALHVAVQWAIYDRPIQKRTLADHFARELDLNERERDWIASQQSGWLSVWEVLSIEPGREITLRDLLTGEQRTVRERKASRSLVARDAVLARVVDHGGVTLFCGMYARSLPPFNAAYVVRDIRARLRAARGDVPVARLRGGRAGLMMLRLWADAVEKMDRRRATPPVITNTDGDVLAFITDRFSIDPVDRQVVKDRIGALAGAGEPDAEGDETHIALFKPETLRDGEDATVIAHVVVGDRMVRVETNSERRAAGARRRIEDVCGALIRHRSREQRDPFKERDIAMPSPTEPGEAEQTLIREFKERHYRKWLDEPVPVLGGKTPRQAARSRAGREQLDLLLRSIEHGEQRLAAAARFDVTRLRAVLGM